MKVKSLQHFNFMAIVVCFFYDNPHNHDRRRNSTGYHSLYSSFITHSSAEYLL